MAIKKLIKVVCTQTLADEGFEGNAEISVVLTDDKEIQQLNREYREKDKPTDVLSFPIIDGDRLGDFDFDRNVTMLGDVVISLERAKEQAEEFGHSIEREVGYLTAHSILHLLGYDHETGEDDRRIMREKEEKVMSGLDLKRD